MNTTTSAATMRRAYATIERLQQRVDEYESAKAERAAAEPIAIIGLACRFPGGVGDPATYWDLLSSGRDGVGEVPPDRWDVEAFYDREPQRPGKTLSRWGGLLENIDRFDHDFFGISRREAVSMDPQQRLILEVSWAAIEDAGLAPNRLAGSHTGVFMGICSSDYSSQVFASPAQITAHASTGNSHGIANGRVSYLLDLKGPSISVDTACSSSLVAVHQASQSLRLGEIDLAICGGVNVVLSPHLSISFSQFPEMLAADGRCKSFDARADGFVRSEGCGVVVLKRLADAVRDRDRVYAVIRGSALNQDGRSSGLTAPNGAAQRAVLRRALEISGVKPEEVGYIETHGAGTKLGDPIEVEALAEVYGRELGAPLYLGAVKSNLGHLEAASGMAGLIKAALCVERAMVTPNLHFTKLNPHISLDGTTFAIPTQLTSWPVDGRRFAGLSSFGFSGTNAHLILEQAPEPVDASELPRPEHTRPVSVLALSAKSETALLKLARRYQDLLLAPEPAAPADVCFSAATGRAHFAHRLAAVGTSAEELAARLADYVRGDIGSELLAGKAIDRSSDVVFLFTGQGPQRAAMAKELFDTQPTFRRVLTRCDEILRPILATPLLDALFPDDPECQLIDDMRYAQPGLFAVEYALAELWCSWGVEPGIVLGHSLGEYAAACFAGAMSLEDGLRLVADRGRLLQQLATSGAMAAIFAPKAQVAEAIARHDPAQVSIAAVNGPANTTISGQRDVVEQVCAALAASGTKVKELRISTSSHSALVEPVLAPLRQALEQITFAPPRIPLVSNVTAQIWQWDRTLDADYWCQHAREPVLFAESVETLSGLGYRTFLEVGPAPTLLGLVGEILPADNDALLLPSLRPNVPDWEVIAGTVSQLYVHGADVDWTGFDRDYARAKVRLPHYAFDRVRCWHEVSGVGGGWPTTAPGSAGLDATAAEVTAIPPVRTQRVSTLPTAAELLAVPAAERVGALVPHLLRSVQGALGSRSSTVDADKALSSLGLDSLMAVELRNELQRRLNASISIASFLSGATTRSMAEQIVAQLADDHSDGDGGDATTIRRVKRVEEVAEDLLRRIEETPAPEEPSTEADRGHA